MGARGAEAGAAPRALPAPRAQGPPRRLRVRRTRGSGEGSAELQGAGRTGPCRERRGSTQEASCRNYVPLGTAFALSGLTSFSRK